MKKKRAMLFILNFITVLLAAYISVGLLPAGFGRPYESIGWAVRFEVVLSIATLVILSLYWIKKRKN